jgi:DNA-binding GntR family transcriptional regulator
MDGIVEKSPADSRALEVAARLEEEIALGVRVPNERLVEEDLAQQFGVKRHVVRQALLDLVNMGLIVRQPNRGAAVRTYTIEEVEQLFAVRALVEGEAVRFMPIPASPALIERLKEIHARHCAAAERGDLRSVFRENLDFHRTLFASCGNVPLAEIIAQLAFKTHGIRSYAAANPQILAGASEDHAEIIRLLQTDRREDLVRLVREHLEPSKQAYLQHPRHRAMAAGQP